MRKPYIPERLETERLVLTIPEEQHAPRVQEAIEASFPELQRWLTFARKLPSLAETKIGILEDRLAFQKAEVLRYHLFAKENGAFIGAVRLHEIEWDIPKLEIGYWIDSRRSGSGFILEAVNAVTTLAFHDFYCQRVEIRCDAANSRSRAVAERAGFALEGLLHNDEWSMDGTKLIDTCIYGKWRERR